MRVVIVMLLGLLVSCASSNKQNGDEVLGVARSATPETIFVPPSTRDDWVAIADKIHNGEYDFSVAIAMTAYEMPSDLDTPELRLKLEKLAYDHMINTANNSNYGEVFGLKRNTNSGDYVSDEKPLLPDSDEWKEIWSQLQEAVKAQNSKSSE